MRFDLLTPAWLWGLALIPLVFLRSRVRPRLVTVSVPALDVWKAEVAAPGPPRDREALRRRPQGALEAWILAASLALGVAALAEPVADRSVMRPPAMSARVYFLDNGPSMAVLEGASSRWALAGERLQSEWDAQEDHAASFVGYLDERGVPRLEAISDGRRGLARALAARPPLTRPPDAALVAEILGRLITEPDTELVIATDGGSLPGAFLDKPPARTQILAVGTPAQNQGLLFAEAAWRLGKRHFEIFAQVWHPPSRPATVPRLAGGDPAPFWQIEGDRGLRFGGQVTSFRGVYPHQGEFAPSSPAATLDLSVGADRYPTDDRWSLTLPDATSLRVYLWPGCHEAVRTLVGDLLADEGLIALCDRQDAELLVTDRAVPEDFHGSLLFLGATSPGRGYPSFSVESLAGLRAASNPPPWAAGIDAAGLESTGASRVFTLAEGDPIAECLQGPVIVAQEHPDHLSLLIGLDLDRSNLVHRTEVFVPLVSRFVRRVHAQRRRQDEIATEADAPRRQIPLAVAAPWQRDHRADARPTMRHERLDLALPLALASAALIMTLAFRASIRHRIPGASRVPTAPRG